MIGAKDSRLPKINLLSWYIYIIGGCFVLYSFAPAGWTPADLLHPAQQRLFELRGHYPAVLGIFINGFSSILTGLKLHRHHPHHALPPA